MADAIGHTFKHRSIHMATRMGKCHPRNNAACIRVIYGRALATEIGQDQ